MAVFQRARIVGVAGTRIGERRTRAGQGIHQRAHRRRVVIAIAHEHGDRRSERFAAAHAGEKLDGIAFDLHARAASVTALPARKHVVDRRDVEREMRGNAVDDADERGAVRFAGCEVGEHRTPAFRRQAVAPPLNGVVRAATQRKRVHGQEFAPRLINHRFRSPSVEIGDSTARSCVSMVSSAF